MRRRALSARNRGVFRRQLKKDLSRPKTLVRMLSREPAHTALATTVGAGSGRW